MMKRVFTLLTFFMITIPQLHATHVAGGTIWYEYIGDSTQTPHHYMIHLELLRRNETGSAGLGASVNIDITSTCFGSKRVTLNRVSPTRPSGDGGQKPNDKFGCDLLGQNSPSRINHSIHHYKSDVILSGGCSDFKFSFELCCLNGNISNLQNASSQNFYIESLLDNTLAPNSSARFMSSEVNNYCVGQPVTSFHFAADSNSDSLYYSLANPLDEANTPITYASGYSATNPISDTNGVYFDSLSGTMKFTPSQIEYAIVKVRVEEYRWDTLFNTYLKSGEVSRQLPYIIGGMCDSTQLNYAFSKDSLDINANISPKCWDSIIKIKMNKAFMKEGISKDGSGFTVYSHPAQAYLTIDSAGTNAPPSSLAASEIWLYLNQPLNYDGQFTVHLKADSLLNVCGIPMSANDSVSFIAEKCKSEISLNEVPKEPLKVFPSPANDYIHIELSGTSLNGWYGHIIDAKGKAVLQLEPFTGNRPVFIGELAKGIYILNLSHPTEGRIQTRFIKK